MRTLTSPLAVLPLSLLLACPPVGPGPIHEPRPPARIALESGAWSIEVVDADMEGRCEGLMPRDIIGQEIRAQLRLRGDGRAVVDMDGMVLRGHFDGRFLEAAGFQDAGFRDGDRETEPDEPRPDGEDEGAPPPCEIPDEPDRPDEGFEPSGEHDLEVYLFAEARSPRLLDGSMVVAYDLPGMHCVLEAEIEARRISRHGDYGVVVAEETEGDCDGDEADCG